MRRRQLPASTIYHYQMSLRSLHSEVDVFHYECRCVYVEEEEEGSVRGVAVFIVYVHCYFVRYRGRCGE